MLLYIHVPFCRKKCRYCSFYSGVLPEGERGAQLIKQYLTTLLQELALWRQRLGPVAVETVFFGGGTPSLLPERAIAEILEHVNTAFTLADNAEISLEANPESAQAVGWLAGIRKAGVNRLSLGVQSTLDDDLFILGRPHTVQDVSNVMESARKANFSNISLDLMWGLPGIAKASDERRPQRQRQWLLRLEDALFFEPDHIAAYGLTVEADTPFATLQKSGHLILPDEKAQAAMYMHGADYLEAQGYMQYEISNFSRIGFECRHNLGYWDALPYLGLGPAAVSTLKHTRWTNPAHMGEWTKAVREATVGQGALVEHLDAQTRLRELLMLRLRTVKGLRLAAWQEATGRPFLTDFGSLVRPLQKNGLALIRNDHLRLTRSGMLVSNTILEHFFAAIPHSA